MFKDRELLLKKPILIDKKEVVSSVIDPTLFSYSIKIVDQFSTFDGQEYITKREGNEIWFKLNEGTVFIQNLAGCKIYLLGNMSQIFLRDIKDCTF